MGDTGAARDDTGAARGDTGATRGDSGATRGDTGAARGDSGAAMGDSGGGNVDCGEAETTGNGAVDGWDGAALPVVGCPQTGQNQAPGDTECPHAGLLEPATPAIITAG
jgi:hypothetical protein